MKNNVFEEFGKLDIDSIANKIPFLINDYKYLQKYFNKLNMDIINHYKYGTNKIENYFIYNRVQKVNKILKKYDLYIHINDILN